MRVNKLSEIVTLPEMTNVTAQPAAAMQNYCFHRLYVL